MDVMVMKWRFFGSKKYLVDRLNDALSKSVCFTYSHMT
jgi:hypothetical protein